MLPISGERNFISFFYYTFCNLRNQVDIFDYRSRIIYYKRFNKKKIKKKSQDEFKLKFFYMYNKTTLENTSNVFSSCTYLSYLILELILISMT